MHAAILVTITNLLTKVAYYTNTCVEPQREGERSYETLTITLSRVELVLLGGRLRLRFIFAMSSPNRSPVRSAEIRSSNSPDSETKWHIAEN